MYRHLLKHPVVALFLAMKWRRMGAAYNRNLFFYTAFVAFLTGYIFSLYAGNMLRATNVFNETICVVDSKSKGKYWTYNTINAADFLDN